jgi:NAD(P)-dependent dehydrogenase (short-subunit alcohol dehydrogenase family)
MKLEGKVAIVVGGGSGAGRASSKLLAQEGAKVMVADINIEAANKVAQEIKAAGGIAATVKVDMTKEKEAFEMAKATLDRFGQIDILANVAGGAQGPFIREKMGPFAEQTKEEWDRIIDINLNGARNCTRAVISHMMERKSGKIVSFSSIAAVTGIANGVDYSAAKAGIIAFTKSLAIAMAPYGINVNCVTPSLTLTERMLAAMKRRQQENPQAPAMNTSTGALPEELAAAVLFLVSDDAKHVSGQNIIFGMPAAR